MRAAGAVKRGAERRVHGLFQHRILGVEKTQARLDQVAGDGIGNQARDAAGDDTRHLRDGKIRLRGQQPFAAWRHPFAFFVELADDTGAHVVAPVVQLLF
ncbi:hypothetical protein D3C72_2053580 [compost metagenome]